MGRQFCCIVYVCGAIMTHQIRLAFTVTNRLVVGDIDGIRERSSAELVHYRKGTNEPCHLCNQEGHMVWLDSLERWRNHNARCNAVAFICKGK